MNTLFVAVFLATAAAVFSNPCDEGNYMSCLKHVHAFTYKDDLIFGLSREELRRECIIAQRSLECLKRHARKCLPLEDRETFLFEIAGPEETITGFCGEESDLNARYFDIMPCILNASDGLRYCRDKYNRNELDILKVPYENKQQLRCCSFDGYRRCVRMLMELQVECVENTADVTEEITLKMGGSKFLEQCSDHFEHCTGSGSTWTRGPSLIAVFLIFAAILQ